MYFCILLTNQQFNYNLKIKYLQYIKDNIFGKLVAGENKDGVISNIDKFLDNINQKQIEYFPFSVLLNHLKKLLGKTYDEVKFKEYCQVIYDNLGILITLFDDMMKSCKSTGLDAKNIVEGHNLWGGKNNEDADYRRYMKYKAKYFKQKMQQKN
jgi:hypothetical protein